MQLLKSKEQKILEAAKKEKQRQEQVIHEIEMKAQQRQAVIDAANRKYENEMASYRTRCSEYGAHLKPADRLLLFLSKYRWSDVPSSDYPKLIKLHGLEEVFDIINKAGKAPEQPPVKPVLPSIEE